MFNGTFVFVVVWSVVLKYNTGISILRVQFMFHKFVNSKSMLRYDLTSLIGLMVQI